MDNLECGISAAQVWPYLLLVGVHNGGEVLQRRIQAVDGGEALLLPLRRELRFQLPLAAIERALRPAHGLRHTQRLSAFRQESRLQGQASYVLPIFCAECT